MEADNSSKAPVTRLRRRLSVESTEERSSTPNTPTKKRGRPPKLIQIDENDVTPQKSTPKRVTRKTTKEGLEPLDDKPLTPVRRSTRTKSNTSIVSDIVTTTTGDTPRAKRVTRRNSQLGSDSEILLTPAKQTRRTRKDSTPNLDKDEIEKAVPQITEIIAEEAEFVEKSFSTPSHSPSNNKSKNSSGIVIDEAEKKSDNSVIDDSKNKSLVKSSSPPSSDIQKENISPGPKHNKKGNLSASTIDLLNNVDKFSKTDTLNKTTSFMESNIKPYKKRTMSWTTNSSTSNETLKQEQNDINLKNNNDSGVGSLSQNLKSVKVIVDKMDIDQVCNKSGTENKHKDISSEELFNKDPNDVSKPEIIIEEFNTEINIKKTQNTQDQFVPVVDVSSPNVNVSMHKSKTDKSMNSSCAEKMFNDSVEPMDIDQTIPESMIIHEKNESSTELNNRSRKSSLSSDSKRKSSVSRAMETENKSTLILSENNDNPSQINILGKSPMPSDNTFSSKSLVDLDKTQNLDKEPKNQSITCLTSTPLQQKSLQRLIAPMNASIIKSTDNIDGTPKSFVDTNSPLSKNDNIALSSASKSLNVDDDCGEKVPEDKITNIDQSIKSVNDSQIKDNCKNISMSNKSNVFNPKDEDSKNNVSSESIKPKEDKLVVNAHSSEDSSDDMPNFKANINESKNKSKKYKMINDESDDSEISNDESIAKNDLVNDEADDAGDDYESGDSQDEEDVRYAKENEIIDKGVTLTSDEDFSNDSDYERDSFIVSSDEEDNQLLEGTEDDLSMSDNELKMTAKSKKKYNERMIKEQKKASREMFESRHKLNIKKKNVIEDDSDSKSDDDNSPKQRKKNNRMRLDSSHETSGLNESKSRTEIKKRLSESNEMTQMNVSSQETDPTTTSIKKDPKSPKKGDKRTNTTLDFEVSSNRSQLNNIEKDEENPLESKKDDETSSESDTNNIISNYDSVLSTLNKASKVDTSLNLDVKKKMKNKRASIIDELNLTQSGKKESFSNKTLKQNPDKNDLVKDDDNSSSDSINLKLLISEDSNTDSIITKNEDEAASLKESEDKIDLINSEEENMDCGSENLFFIDTKGNLEDDAPAEETIIKDKNISNIKTPKSEKKKQRLSKSQGDINVTLIEEIDHQNTSSATTPKSDRKKQVFESMADNVTSTKETIQDQNISIVKTPKSEKKKKQKLSESIADIEDATREDKIQIQNTSSVKTPKSEKKKKQKLSEFAAEENVDDAPVEEKIIKELNTSNKTPQSEKKQKLSKSQTAEALVEEIADQSASSIKTPSDKKERRLSKSHLDIEVMLVEDQNTSNVKTPKSEKKKQKLSQSHTDIDVVPEDDIDQNTSSIKTPKSEKKKKNKLTQSAIDVDVSELNLSQAKTPKSDKKKKQDFSESQGNIQELDSSNVKTPKSAKKKKLSLSESQTNIQELNSSHAKTPKSAEKKKQELSKLQYNQELDSEANTPKSQKKKKNQDASQTNIEEAPIEEIVAEVNNVKTPKSDKKKKRKSGNIEDANVVEEVSIVKTPKSAEKLPQNHVEDLVYKQEIDLTKTKGEKKKKKQMLQSADSIEGQSEDLVKGKKKRKRSNTCPVEDIIETASQSNGNEKKKRKIKNTDETVKVADVKKSKKRKEREDDDHDQPKVHPSSSKMTVPRLPMSIITQLADNPKIQARKKPKVISTSQFIVEDYRRKMPSTYLEESVYLNDDSPEKKKPKKKIPKVLPSMPSTSSSNHGFTTTFKVNVISAETKFVAQADNVANFREDRLYNRNRKRRTYEHLKKHTNSKLSKF